MSQYLKLYLKINPRTGTDLLAMQYHKRAVIYRQRFDQTEPLDTTDVEEHRRSGRHRSVAFMRDWKNLDAIKQAAKRDEELCTDEASSLPKYFAEYDIEPQQPRSGHAKLKIAHAKVTETGDFESALSISRRTFSTVRPQATSSTQCLKFSKSFYSTTVHRRSHFEVALEATGASLWRHLVLGRVRLLLGSELTRSALVQIGLITTACALPFVGGGNSSNSTNSNDRPLRMADVASKLRLAPVHRLRLLVLAPCVLDLTPCVLDSNKIVARQTLVHRPVSCKSFAAITSSSTGFNRKLSSLHRVAGLC